MTSGDFVLSGGGRHCGNSVRLDIIRRRAGRRGLGAFSAAPLLGCGRGALGGREEASSAGPVGEAGGFMYNKKSSIISQSGTRN